jgi:hypothetical protein
MSFFGRIEPLSKSGEIDWGAWLALIDSHESLRHVLPRLGTNPFTHGPCEIKAPASTAVIRIGGADVGQIYQAMDGSPLLIVQAQKEYADTIATLAQEVATTLGARFVRESGGN